MSELGIAVFMALYVLVSFGLGFLGSHLLSKRFDLRNGIDPPTLRELFGGRRRA
jgi:hypothetical protein